MGFIGIWLLEPFKVMSTFGSEDDLIRKEGASTQGHLPDGCVARFYRPGDEVGILELLDASFAQWPAVEASGDRLAHLRWKIRSAPDSIRYQVVAELDSKIIACRLSVLRTVSLGGKLVSSRQGVDAVVHPGYQGSGLMTALTHPMPDRLRNFDMYFGLRSGTEGFMRMERREDGPVYYPEVRVMELSGIRLEGALIEADKPAPVDWSVHLAARFDERVDAFSTEASRPFWFIVHRAKDYLNWRYADPNGGRFTIKLAERGDQLLGFSALRFDAARGFVADLLALPGRVDVAASLARDALVYFRENGVTSIQWWATRNHPYGSTFARLGFREKGRKVFFCQPIRLSGDRLRRFEDGEPAIHVTAGDSDLI